MNKKHHGGPAPVPPGNRPKGIASIDDEADDAIADADVETGFQDQDVKRRLGNFGGAGEHPRQQPTALNDGRHHGK